MRTSEAMRSVIGIDLGDRYSYLHELNMQTGETKSQTRLPTKPEAFGKHFASIHGCASPWKWARIHPGAVAFCKTWDIRLSSPIRKPSRSSTARTVSAMN